MKLKEIDDKAVQCGTVMKISVYKNSEEYLTREYKLTNVSVKELTNGLYQHCEIVNVESNFAGIVIVKEYPGECDHVLKRTSEAMSMQDVAINILKYFKGR